MDFDDAKQIHRQLVTFMGLFHEKFLLRFRSEMNPWPDLKKNHMKIINILYHESPITLTEIGKRLDIEKGSLTTLIDVLEEKELVIRSNDPKDRRRNLLYLSPQGKEEMEQRIAFYAKKMDEYLTGFDPKEIKVFKDNLEGVINFFSKV